MDSTTACHELREPGVIDESMIYNAIIEQGPKAEEGRLFKEQGIEFANITYLRLEFLDILKIDHLWMMTGLTKLQLCNNIIEEIENLEMLTELRELDLSFNNIEKIKNLDTLFKLEVLTLFENKIEVIENIHHLTKLTVLSVGNNKISDFDNVLYLRGFESLKSLNMTGNPICEDENFVNHVIACLPQLVYYEYKMIKDSQKIEARELYVKDLVKLEREEAELREIRETEKKAEEEERINEAAFVEGLGGDQLFSALFENDTDGKTLLQMGDHVMEIYKEFRNNFCEVTKEILLLGREEAEIRRAEIEEYTVTMKESTDASYAESRKVMEAFLHEKADMFQQIKSIMENEEEDDDVIAELSLQVQIINENFQELCFRTWNILMKKELHFYEACEEVNSNYERALTELVNHFVENAQTLFTQLRQLQGIFNENITDAANKFFTMYTVNTAGATANLTHDFPPDLSNMLQDRELLMNGLATSHDMHLLVIDQREDKLISGVRNWLANLVDNMMRAEVQRNRDTVTEINYFLDLQKSELEEITSTPLGLLLLPKEVQDALQMS